ncbi:MAG TPA: hypothetical protein VMX77_00445 [Candidatus Bathyarchaeia archaeon]|nr:hypothetical protein [Candidatus Bathyarchaeia archaeon]
MGGEERPITISQSAVTVDPKGEFVKTSQDKTPEGFGPRQTPAPASLQRHADVAFLRPHQKPLDEELQKAEDEQLHERQRALLAVADAERWFLGLMAEVRVIEEYGKATNQDVRGIIRGHLIGNFYNGDIWNTFTKVHGYLQNLDSDVIEGSQEDFLERQRLTFISQLETAGREKIDAYLPEPMRQRLKELADQVRLQEWRELEIVAKLLEKRREISGFAKEEYREDFKAAQGILAKANAYNAEHGLPTSKDLKRRIF